MIPNITQFTGDFPDINDPVTFDARMTIWQGWFDGFDAELFSTVAGMNTALNDNGTVLDAAAEATRRSTNSAVTEITAGSTNAYTVSAAVTVPALVADEPVAVRFHEGNTGAATLDVDGLGAVSIQKRDNSGALVDLVGGDIAPYDEHIVVYNGTVWALVTTILREILTGPALVAPSTDFNELQDGGAWDISGSWINGPTGGGASTYTGNCVVVERNDTNDNFLTQRLSLVSDGNVVEWQRYGTGFGPVVWSAWQKVTVNATGDAPIYGARAWAKFSISGSTVTVDGSANVDSVVRNSTGVYVVTFTEDMAGVGYAAVVSAWGGSNSDGYDVGVRAQTASDFIISAEGGGGTTSSDPSSISVVVFQ